MPAAANVGATRSAITWRRREATTWRPRAKGPFGCELSRGAHAVCARQPRSRMALPAAEGSVVYLAYTRHKCDHGEGVGPW